MAVKGTRNTFKHRAIYYNTMTYSTYPCPSSLIGWGSWGRVPSLPSYQYRPRLYLRPNCCPSNELLEAEFKVNLDTLKVT